MKTTLILHIACAIIFGITAVTASNPLGASISTLAAMAWSVCVGMDIAHMSYDD